MHATMVNKLVGLGLHRVRPGGRGKERRVMAAGRRRFATVKVCELNEGKRIG